jgi:hypothetical protein
MAIKGKGKTKARPVARAPRREPVVVKPPVWARRWVQLTSMFVVGLLVAALIGWVVGNLNKEEEATADAAKASRKTSALQQWQAAVDGAFGTVGTVSQAEAPVVLPDLATAVISLGKGEVPDGSAKKLGGLAKSARAAEKQLSQFDASTAISNADAFSSFEALKIVDSQENLVLSLDLFARSAALAQLASLSKGREIKALAIQAGGLSSRAQTTLKDAYNGYLDMLQSSGVISLTPPSGSLPIP